MLARLLVPAVAACILAADTPRAQPPAPGLLPPATIGTATIAGRVVIAGTDPAEPVRRGRVTLSGGILSERRFTDTDTLGYYRFEQLPAGAYHIRAEKPGFVSLEYGTTRPFVQAEPIALRDRETLTANLVLPRGAALEGRLLTEAGDAVQNATVSAVRLVHGPAGRRPTAVQQAQTDDLGRYRLHSLPAGDYYIEAAPDPRLALDAASARRAKFGRMYYPGTARVNEAQPVKVAAGADLGNLDITLTPIETAQVTVQIVDSTGKAPATGSVRLQPVGGPTGQVAGFGDPRTRGTFVYPGVAAGEYWVTAAAIPAPAGDPEFAATRVTVTGANAQLTVNTERGARIDGRVELESNAAAPLPRSVHIVAHETEFDLPNPGGPSAPAAPIAAPDGWFMIASLFGPRLIRVAQLPPGFALKSVLLDGTDITDTIVDFRASNAARPMRILVTDRTGGVAGTVVGANQAAVTDYQVIVFSEDESRWLPRARSRFVRAATRVRGGPFAIDALLPGAYLIGATNPLDDESWTDPDVLRRLRVIATPIAITTGVPRTVTLTLKALP